MSNIFLGIDTSNYTSSCAFYLPEKDEFVSKKQLLPVKHGEMGLRQSNAVFHHTKNLPHLLSDLIADVYGDVKAVSSSFAPRDEEGSYMPCFCVGEGFADVLSCAYRSSRYSFSHQAGHIAAALWSSGMSELCDKKFIAFHVSGGTTDVLLVAPDNEKVFRITPVCTTLDLKAGQAVDRVGGMLGLDFPAGPKLDDLACESGVDFKIKPYVKDGSCSFSGLENKCRDMLKNGADKRDTAKYCIDYIYEAVCVMTEYAFSECGELPVVYAGGVMSNSIINKRISERFGGHFAEPYYSSDNAAGVAYLGFLKEQMK